ncbi:MAG: hypothetical protein QOH32_4062 [Bradyrhizobium sp.]|jgi:predicted acylesterase/phospholipase RssA|nr:hypothetical protein [Bradyrhizobium sp.]
MPDTSTTPENPVLPASPVTPQPLLDCDIVMAGGVTSGIIYPGAVEMISRRYRFRSIGGTSVGAIAAATTAAAEYGRLTGQNHHSFAEFGQLPKSLGDAAQDGHSRLFHLFTPEPATGPLLALVTPLFGGGGFWRQATGVFKATMRSPLVATIVMLTALAGLYVVVRLGVDKYFVAMLIAGLAAAALVFLAWLGGVAWMLERRWLPEWRNNGYGICTGNTAFTGKRSPNLPAFEGLTPWMHHVIQQAAGRAFDQPPLTFGELWTAGTGKAPDRTAARTIELSMIASDISRNRTLQLPFIESPSPIYVEVRELERYFPKVVVDWFRDRPGSYDDRVEKREEVVRLPEVENVPVVFAARLSLSFPVLLSAFPLLTPEFGKKNREGKIPLRRLWLSDGGLTSNCPVHFFDSPIPAHPTFCLNLIDYGVSTEQAHEVTEPAAGDTLVSAPGHGEVGRTSTTKAIAQPRAEARSAVSRGRLSLEGDPPPGDPVWDFISMPKGNQFSPVPFTAFDSAPGTGVLPFVSTLLNTARFWADNQMLIAPGVRDRVVNIALREDEGGLNLI